MKTKITDFMDGNLAAMTSEAVEGDQEPKDIPGISRL